MAEADGTESVEDIDWAIQIPRAEACFEVRRREKTSRLSQLRQSIVENV